MINENISKIKYRMVKISAALKSLIFFTNKSFNFPSLYIHQRNVMEKIIIIIHKIASSMLLFFHVRFYKSIPFGFRFARLF